MTRIAILVECILAVAVVGFCVLWLRGGNYEPHATTASALLVLVEWLRRRSSPSRAKPAPEQRDTSPNGHEVEYTKSIPLTTQTISLTFGQRGHSGPLTMRDGCRVRAEVQVDWRVVNPYLFLFSTEGHPLNGLVPKLLSRFRGCLEELDSGSARSRRREIERTVREELASEWKACGIVLESVTLGAIDELKASGS